MRTFQLERISTVWFLTLGITSLAAGILVYILLLESALGAFSIREASPLRVGIDLRPRVALLNSDYTKQAHKQLGFRDTSTAWVDQTVISWREFLIKQDPEIPFEDISDDSLEAGTLDRFDVLVLPSVRAMSDRQIEEVKRFMQDGGSVLATWQTGIYREDGSWRGWGFLEETFGLEFESNVGPGPGNFQVYADTFPGVVPEGIYLRRQIVDSDRFSGREVGPEILEMRRTYRTAAEDFNALSEYVWYDTLLSARPNVDFARAVPLRARLTDMDGIVREQDAVAVSYFRWTGFNPNEQLPYPQTNAGTRRFTIRGGTPLSAGIPAGYRVKVQVYNDGVSTRIRDTERTRSGGFWFDFATDDLVGFDQIESSTGLAYGTYGKGRFVYMGFQRNATGVGGLDDEDNEALTYLFKNTLSYLRRLPTIWVHTWPYAAEAAAMVTGATSTSEGIARFGAIADILDAQDVPGTWLVRPELASAHTSLLRRLHAQGDVAVYDSLRTDGDGVVAVQARRLRDLRIQLENLVGAPVKGYRSTERGIFGSNTMNGLVNAGYEYFLPDSIGRRMSPKIMGPPYERLTRIGVTVRSDRDIINGVGGGSEELLADLTNLDMRRAVFEGGLYNMVYDPEVMGSEANRSILRSTINELRSRNVWIASGDSIAHWWRLLRGLQADVKHRSPSRIFVRVSNGNGHTAKEATVSISLGRSVAAVNVRPELINIFKSRPEDVDIPPYQLKENGTVLELSIRELKPQQYRIYHIDLLGGDLAEAEEVLE